MAVEFNIFGSGGGGGEAQCSTPTHYLVHVGVSLLLPRACTVHFTRGSGPGMRAWKRKKRPGFEATWVFCAVFERDNDKH